jgi:hypothetical protein
MFRNFLVVAVAASMSACVNNTEVKQEAPAAVEPAPVVKEKWSQTTETGTITNIVKETREITLMGEKGNLVTFIASAAVERFDEIAVGDRITFDHLVYIKAEFREPNAEEIANPLQITTEVAKAPENLAPAGGVGAMVKGIVTIEVLNRPFMLATVKGPKGNYLTLPMEDSVLIEKLHIGQTLVLTYAETDVVSLTKVDAAK